jgi:hypothetical protein
MGMSEGVMSGKYSAQWWEKIAGMSCEVPPRQDPASVVDDLIQATASGSLTRGKSAKRRDLDAPASKDEDILAG